MYLYYYLVLDVCILILKRYFGALSMTVALSALSVIGWGYVGRLANRLDIGIGEINNVASVLFFLVLAPVSIGLPGWLGTNDEGNVFTALNLVYAGVTAFGLVVLIWLELHVTYLRPFGDEVLSRLLLSGHTVALVALTLTLYLVPTRLQVSL